MSEQLARTFIEALHALENDRDVEPLAALYTADAPLGNVLRPDRFRGPDGARQFWTEYRGTFDDVESRFRNVIAAGDRAALEWRTRGTSQAGKSVQYDGVTVLEMADDRITRSCAYFDPAALGEQIT